MQKNEKTLVLLCAVVLGAGADAQHHMPDETVAVTTDIAESLIAAGAAKQVVTELEAQPAKQSKTVTG